MASIKAEVQSPPEGTRAGRASVKDVAALAGVSPSTVSNFLLRPHLLSEQTRERVQSAIDTVGYVPNESARQLRAGASKTLGLVLLDAWLPFFADLSHGVDDAARSRGWSLFYSNSGRDHDRELANLDMFEAHRVEGLIVSPQGKIAHRLRQLQSRGIECVTISPSDRCDEVSTIEFDDFRGGELAGQHLLDIGRTRIVFMGNPNTVTHSANRLAGLSATVQAAGLDAQILSVTVPDLTIESGMEAARQILTLPAIEQPDAVFAANDMLAIGAMTVFLRSGIRVPEDIAIVGFDDVAYAHQAVVPLTSVKQPAYEMGWDAATTLIDLITTKPPRQPRHITHPPTLIVRESTTGRNAEPRWDLPRVDGLNPRQSVG